MLSRSVVRALSVAVALLVFAVTAPGGAVDRTEATPSVPAASPSNFDEPVPRDQLAARCGLDPNVMAQVDGLLDGAAYVVFRHGQYCWRSSTPLTELLGLHNPSEIFSSTKTFAAILVGAVAARSSLEDTSLMTDFLSREEIEAFNPDINPQARVAHVLAMTATSPDLSYGSKDPYSYDPLGDREINILIPLLNRVIEREPARFDGATDVEQYVDSLFEKLGMTQTTWSGDSLGFGVASTPVDLARLGELVLRRGMWNGEQVIDERYMYRMTHPSFEDVNTGMGYLTWMNAAENATQAEEDPDCSPYPRWPVYPHAPFHDAPDANGGYPFAEAPLYDDGVVWSAGLNGSAFAVHRGLDLVIATNFSLGVGGWPLRGNHNYLWDRIRPALVATLPQWAGNEAGFCDTYRRGNWADIRSPWTEGASGPT